MFENISYFIAVSTVALITLSLIYFIIIIPNRNSQLQHLLDKEDYRSAEIFILDILKKEPSHAKMLGILGDIYWSTDRQEKAVDIFEKLVNIPNLSLELTTTPLFRLVTWYNQKDLLLEASEILERLLILDPKNPQFLSTLGDIYHKQNDLEKSIATYKNVIALNAKNMQAWRALAYIYFSLKMYTEAYQAFSNLLELDATEPDFLFKLAEICEIKGESDKALKYYERIEKFNDPHYSFRSVKKISSIYKFQNQQTNYIKSLEKARFIVENNKHFLVEKEDVLDVRYQLAESYLSHDLIHLAIKEWEKILKIEKYYLDVAQKFELYHTRQTFDFFTDVLTHRGPALTEIISIFITSLGYQIDSIQSYGEETFDFFVSESSAKWRAVRRRKNILSFWCSNDPLPADIATRLIVAIESRGVAQVYIISSGPILSETRERFHKKNITIFDQNNIQELINVRKEITTND